MSHDAWVAWVAVWAALVGISVAGLTVALLRQAETRNGWAARCGHRGCWRRPSCRVEDTATVAGTSMTRTRTMFACSRHSDEAERWVGLRE